MVSQMRTEISAACSRAASEIASRYGNPKFSVIVTNDAEKGAWLAKAVPMIERGMTIDQLIDEKRGELSEIEGKTLGMKMKCDELEGKVAVLDNELKEKEARLVKARETVERIDRAFEEIYALINDVNASAVNRTVSNRDAQSVQPDPVQVVHIESEVDEESRAREIAQARLAAISSNSRRPVPLF